MVAYTLPSKANRTAVVDGRRHILLAAPRADDSRNAHPGAGGRIHLKTARTATSNGHHLPAGLISFSGLVTFSVEGIVRLVDYTRFRGGQGERGEGRSAERHGEGIVHLLAGAEQGSTGNRRELADRIAIAAGFKDYADLWASLRKDDGEVIARQLIAWVLA